MLAYDALRLAWLPDRDVHVAATHLNRRCAGQVGRVQVVELQSPQIEPGVFEQIRGEPLMQRLVPEVANHAPQLRIALGDLCVTVAVCMQNRGSRPRSRNLVVCGMPAIHNWPSKILGSIGLILGKPSERRVASRHKLPVAAWRRAKTAAIRGAASVNSSQVVMLVTLRHTSDATTPEA